MRYFFNISYDGSAFHGWQAQNNAPSVQEAVERALGTLLRKNTTVTGSSRTDAGVHALQQVFHMDTNARLDTAQVRYKLNALLDRSIAVHAIRPVRANAHARYDAVSRTYEYRICRSKDPFEYGRAYLYYKALDLDGMSTASSMLTGRHDFQAFSKVKTNVNHFICNVFESYWFDKERSLCFRIRADRFLRGMVRALVGTMLEVGEKKITADEFSGIMMRKDRRKAGPAVPPDGLYLMRVQYSPDLYID